jgi:flagellar basal body-associated protein FliL
MADAKKDDKVASVDPAAAAAKKRKVMLFGGVVGGLALAFVAALMAVPKPPAPTPEVRGPFVGPLTPDKVQVNLSDGRSYFVLKLDLLYEAYDAEYLTQRTADKVCQAEIRDALVAICSSKSRNDVVDKVNKPVFLEEVRRAVEPLLFPVHVGEGASPLDTDPRSGLGAGDSMSRSTFTGLFEEHALTIDAVQKKLSLDDGAELAFNGDERDFELSAPDGSKIWIDLSRLEPEFSGTVKIGIKGRTKRVLWNEALIQ